MIADQPARMAVRYQRPAGSFVAFGAPGESFADFAESIRRRWPDTIEVRELHPSGVTRNRRRAAA